MSSGRASDGLSREQAAGAAAAAGRRLDFIVIGAQKSATNALRSHLRRHPEVTLPAGREAPFFSHDEMYGRGWDAYIRTLASEGRMSTEARMWGTVTPQYMAGGVLNPARDAAPGGYDERTVPRRIHERLPDVRLVAILRDPVQRAISHHGMVTRRGGERRGFDETVEELLRPEALRAARAAPSDPTGYIVWGEYGRILDGYLDVFERERLLILFTHDLERAPLELLARLYGFVGASGDFVPDDVERHRFVARREAAFDWRRPGTWMGPTSPISPQGLRRGLGTVPGTKSVWRALPFETRHRLLRPYWQAAARARAVNRRRADPEETAQMAPRPETIERLRAHFDQDLPRLAAMLGGTLPPWAAEGQAAGDPGDPL